MKSLIFLLSIFATSGLVGGEVASASPSSIIAYQGKEKHIANLVAEVVSCDMNKWLLSEAKGSRWLITKIDILREDLVLLHLSDGNGAETALFDWDSDTNSWTIIRRVPVGDWKPEAHKGKGRLSVIPFIPKQAGQDVPPKSDRAGG